LEPTAVRKVRNREVLKKDGAVRKAGSGEYHRRAGTPLGGRKTLGREPGGTAAEMPSGSSAAASGTKL
jgi:hypothetical protein